MRTIYINKNHNGKILHKNKHKKFSLQKYIHKLLVNTKNKIKKTSHSKVSRVRKKLYLFGISILFSLKGHTTFTYI